MIHELFFTKTMTDNISS